MKYGEIIQDLAGRGHNWKFYDENFRFLRQTHYTTMPWDRIQGEPFVNLCHPMCPLYRLNLSWILSPGFIVSVFTRIRNVTQVVLTIIPVLNARVPIRQQNVIFVTCPNNLAPGPDLPTPFQPSLPTPIKVERLRFLLDGYFHSTVTILLSGFTHGFPPL